MDSIPHELGPYKILDVVGEGGTGIVYRAVHGPLDRPVALKVIKPSGIGNEEGQRRFKREMKLVANLRHPALVTVLDAGVIDDVPYFSMEFLTGKNLLDTLVERGPLPWTYAMAAAARMLDGLGRLHELGIVHRDIKLANVMVTTDGVIKILDFSLARSLNTTNITIENQVVGTPLALAPEVLVGDSASPQSDLWSVGVVLYQLLTGVAPVEADTFTMYFQKLVHEPLPPPRSHRPGIPEAVSNIVCRLLEKDPSRRPASADDALAEITALLNQLAGQTIAEALEGRRPRSPPKTQEKAFSHDEQPVVLLPSDSVVQEPTVALRPAAPSSRPSRRWRILGVGGAVALALIAGSSRIHLPPATVPVTPAPIPQHSPGRTPPKRERPAAPSELRMEDEWRMYGDALRLLRAGDPVAKPALRSLRMRMPTDLGESVAVWLHWAQIGAWLAAAGESTPLPDWPGAFHGQMPLPTKMLMMNYLDDFGDDWSRTRFVGVVHDVVSFPADGRFWLALGLFYSECNRPSDARKAYTVALARLSGVSLDGAPPNLWKALAQALVMVHGHNIRTEWSQWLPREKWSEPAAIGLRAAMVDENRATYEAILRGMLDNPHWAEAAVVRLGRLELRMKSDDPSGAIAIWKQGLKRSPGSSTIRSELIGHELSIGNFEEASLYLRDARNPAEWQPLVQYLRTAPVRGTARGDCQTTPPSELGAEGRLELELERLIEQNCWAGVERLLALSRQHQLRDPKNRLEIAAELLGNGSQSAYAADLCHKRLVERAPDWHDWVYVAGALATPSGAGWMKSFVRDAAVRWPRDAAVIVALALWHSRMGNDVAALAALERAIKLTPKQTVPAAIVTEIFFEPLWKWLSTSKWRGLSLKRAEALPPWMFQGKKVRRVFAALNSDKADDLVQVIQDNFLRDVLDSTWALILYRLASSPTASAELQSWKERVRLAVRYRQTGLWFVRQTR